MNRRNFLALGGTALVGSGVKASAQEKSRINASVATAGSINAIKRDRPNILLLMADQWRVDCTGIYGNKIIQTPNLDRLGNEGIRFDCAYSSTPTCTSARSALLSGLGPWSHGMLGMTKMATLPYPVEKASALAQAGYYTTTIGKYATLMAIIT